MKSLVLENHAIFGGEARRNEFEVDGQRLAAHQGSAMFWTPFPYSFIGRFYDSIGLKPPELKYQTWAGSDPEFALPLSPYDIADRKRYAILFPGKSRREIGNLGNRSVGKEAGRCADCGAGKVRAARDVGGRGERSAAKVSGRCDFKASGQRHHRAAPDGELRT